MAESVTRMGDHSNIDRTLTIAEVGGKGLPVYSIGDTTYQSSNITRMGDSVGRYSIGETGVNRLAGAEVAGIVHKGEAGGSG